MSIYSFFKNLFSKNETTVEKPVEVIAPVVPEIVEETKPTIEQIVAKEVVTPAPAKKAPAKKTVKAKAAPTRTVAKKKK